LIAYTWIAGRQQRLHPRPVIHLDPDHHLPRITLELPAPAEPAPAGPAALAAQGRRVQALTDQRVQPAEPLNALRDPSARQPPPGLVDDLQIVMILGPVIPNKDHSGRSFLPRIIAPMSRRRTRAT
jgi:hypothetical protein